MAFDIENIKAVADNYFDATPEARANARGCIDTVLKDLRDEFPAMFDTDQAAVAYFIARLLDAFGNETVSDAADVLQDTCNAYLLAAAELTLGPLG